MLLVMYHHGNRGKAALKNSKRGNSLVQLGGGRSDDTGPGEEGFFFVCLFFLKEKENVGQKTCSEGQSL